jgi:hypothetical protein
MSSNHIFIRYTTFEDKKSTEKRGSRGGVHVKMYPGISWIFLDPEGRRYEKFPLNYLPMGQERSNLRFGA